MNAKLPGLVTLVRRDIVVGEDAAFFAGLTGAYPCDGCPLRQKCASQKLACKAFVVYTHRPDKAAWHRFSTKRPTRELYDVAMADDAPEWALQRMNPGVLQERLEGLRRTMVGQVIHGRTVVDVRTRKQFLIVVRLRCDACGHERNVDLDRVRLGKVAACMCTHTKRLARQNRERTTARYLGMEYKNGWKCVRVETGTLSRTGHGGRTMLVLRHPSGVMVRRDAHNVGRGAGLAPPGDRYCRGSWRE